MHFVFGIFALKIFGNPKSGQKMLFLGSENHYERSKEKFLEKKQKSKNKMLGVFDNKFCELLQKTFGSTMKTVRGDTFQQYVIRALEKTILARCTAK